MRAARFCSVGDRWVVVILLITGIVLSSVYRDATERAFDRRLNVYLRTLSPKSRPRTSRPKHPVARRAAVRAAAVGLVLAGHAAPTEKPETRASRSLWDKKLPHLEERGAD
jgi:hypothetical protein